MKDFPKKQLENIKEEFQRAPLFYICLIFIIILGFFVRLWKLDELLYFNMDEERDAFLAKRILVDKRPLLIGGATPGSLYLGPIGFYFEAFLMIFSRLKPLGLGVFASIAGASSIFLIYLIGKQFFNKRIGIFAALIYATSYLVVIYTQIFWPLTFPPIAALFTYLALFQIKKGKMAYIWLSLFPIILAVQSDASAFAVLAIIIILWFVWKIPKNSKHVFYAILVFFLSHITLLIFDLRHNFFNTKAFLSFFAGGTSEYQKASLNLSNLFNTWQLLPQTASRIIYTAGRHDVVAQILPCQNLLAERKEALILPLTIVGFLIIFFPIFKMFFTKKDRFKDGYTLLGVQFLIVLVAVTFYNLFFPGYTHEWFFFILFPAIALSLAILTDLFWQSKLRYLSILLIGVFIYFNLNAIFIGINSFGLKYKRHAFNFIKENVGTQAYSLDSIGNCFLLGGYRYLAYVFNLEPVKSYMDPTYGNWLYPKSSIVISHPDLVVVMVNPNFKETDEFYQRYNRYLQKTMKRENFGRLEVLIVDNSDKWVSW